MIDPVVWFSLFDIEKNNDETGFVDPLYLRGADVSHPKTPPRHMMGSME